MELLALVLVVLCALLLAFLAASFVHARKSHDAATGASVHPANSTPDIPLDAKLVTAARQKARDIEAADEPVSDRNNADDLEHEDHVDLDGQTLAESVAGGRSASFSSSSSSSPQPLLPVAATQPPLPAASQSPSSKNIVLAREAWKGSKDDEITIRIGDPITVYEKLPNGYALGMNWALGIAGLFPVRVLANGQEIAVHTQSMSRPAPAVLSRQGTLTSRTKGGGGGSNGPR
ncbi:hypothetical protein HDU87_003663 [Geranomyces variabilis]|uniref:SH3 domain-containing protein n=1 Tax=Geranomyces variabilis TaxID=109894 RepID=A0AAD5TJE3_9FUNG|nr:hypothetical protein HDU87_003663 [Geranomyces variabilis]